MFLKTPYNDYSVVAVGGDGTFAEAVNGLLQRQAKEENKDLNNSGYVPSPLETTLGTIPAGQ